MKRRESIVVPRLSGFTLFEIVAVLSLLGILAVGVVSILPPSGAGLAAEAERLAADIRYAQIRAQSDTYQWRLAFVDNQTYQLGPVVIPGPGFIPAIVPGTGATQRTLSGGVTTAAGTVIRFDSWGRPMSDAGILLGADQTVTLAEGGRNAALTIHAGTGLVP